MALRNKIFRIPKETFTWPYFTLTVTNPSDDTWDAHIADIPSGVTVSEINWYLDGQLIANNSSGCTITLSSGDHLLLVDAKDSRELKRHYISILTGGPDTLIAFALEDDSGYWELEDSSGYWEQEGQLTI